LHQPGWSLQQDEGTNEWSSTCNVYNTSATIMIPVIVLILPRFGQAKFGYGGSSPFSALPQPPQKQCLLQKWSQLTRK